MKLPTGGGLMGAGVMPIGALGRRRRRRRREKVYSKRRRRRDY